jgi:hypothetical protein
MSDIKLPPTRPVGSLVPSARPPKKLLDATEARAFDASPVVEPFTAAALPAAERAQATAAAGAATALVLKGLLNRLDPGTYVAPTRQDTPEAAAISVARGLDEGTFRRMTPRLKALAADPARVARMLGAAGAVDLRKPSLGLTLARPIAGAAALHHVGVGTTAEDGPAAPPAPRSAVARSLARYSRMDLVLRAVHCVDETDGVFGSEAGADEIVLGGVLVGASGHTKVVKARFIGDFDDGDYVSLGEFPFGQYSLRTTAGYPKTMYCILQLVESDQDDADAAKALTGALSSIATVAVSALATPAAGAVAGALVSAVGGMIGLFIDDDPFPPYGIRVTLHSENEFGSDADSGRLRTNNIVGQGGAYRVGYRWLLNA